MPWIFLSGLPDFCFSFKQNDFQMCHLTHEIMYNYYLLSFFHRKLTEDYPKYCKSARLSATLAKYVRENLYTYRQLYKPFELVRSLKSVSFFQFFN